MTWGFFFLAFFLVGLVLAAIFGILESLPKSHVALPRAELVRHRRQVHIARLGVALAGFGGAGLILVSWGRYSWKGVMVSALAVALLCWVVCRWLLRLPCAPSILQQKATVVQEIPPGGYGQVRVEAGGSSMVLAAQSEAEETIPAGSEVEVVDCQRSVVVVRKVSPLQ